MPRCGGIATMMRLPYVASAVGLDACFVGVPFDFGTSNRTGTRFGPRQVRGESVLLRPYNMATRAAPFDSLRVADIGDVAINPYNLLDSIDRIECAYWEILSHDCKPLTLGGDHTIVLPILRAMHAKHGKVGLIHVDAHSDERHNVRREDRARHAVSSRGGRGVLDCGRVVQIGLRGTGYEASDFDWCREQGFRVAQTEECWNRSLAPLMDEVRAQMGDGPVYFTFDIDGIDPAFAPGTGTPEIAGLTVPQALEIIRGAWDLNIVGADLAFELLCVLPGVEWRA